MSDLIIGLGSKDTSTLSVDGTQLSFTLDEQTATLTWSQIPGATSYRVFKYDTMTNKWKKYTEVPGLTCQMQLDYESDTIVSVGGYDGSRHKGDIQNTIDIAVGESPLKTVSSLVTGVGTFSVGQIIKFKAYYNYMYGPSGVYTTCDASKTHGMITAIYVNQLVQLEIDNGKYYVAPIDYKGDYDASTKMKLRYMVDYIGITTAFTRRVHTGEDYGYKSYSLSPTTQVGGRNQPICSPGNGLIVKKVGLAGSTVGNRFWGVIYNYASYEDIAAGLVTLPDGKTSADYPNGAHLWVRSIHMDSISVSVGQTLNEGGLLGYMGKTGTSGEHMHGEFELVDARKGDVEWSDALRIEWGIPMHKECYVKSGQIVSTSMAANYSPQYA
ncbi:MAG: M23 family metallopeptidase [Anaerofustis sp.]